MSNKTNEKISDNELAEFLLDFLIFHKDCIKNISNMSLDRYDLLNDLPIKADKMIIKLVANKVLAKNA